MSKWRNFAKSSLTDANRCFSSLDRAPGRVSRAREFGVAQPTCGSQRPEQGDEERRGAASPQHQDLGRQQQQPTATATTGSATAAVTESNGAKSSIKGRPVAYVVQQSKLESPQESMS